MLRTPAFWPNKMPGVSAGSILECIKASLDGSIHPHFNPVIEWSRSLVPFSGNMLELHFERIEAWFDFAYRINKDYDAPLLHSAHLPETVQPFLLNDCHQLLQYSIPIFQYDIENICIEYDFPFGSPPALFLDLHRDKAFTPHKAYEDLKKLASHFQQPVHEELLNFFVKIKRAGLKVVYSGFMLSRKGESIRFTIEGVESDTLSKTISALGWKGDYDVVATLQQTYLQADQRLVLCVDFDRQLGHKLGIEVHAPHGEPLLKKLFTNCIYDGEQYNLLKSWNGITALSHLLSKELTTLHQRSISCVYRRINHFKFTLESSIITTKAYLYYCF